MNFFDPNHLWLFLIFLIPGFVSIKIYGLLIASGNRDFSKSMIEVIAFSAINFALLSWLICPILYFDVYNVHPIVFAFLSFLILFIFPGLWPIVYVWLVKQKWLANHIIQPIKRPWDWFFSQKDSLWVVVTLKDGRKIGGVFSDKSYASSFPLPEQMISKQFGN